MPVSDYAGTKCKSCKQNRGTIDDLCHRCAVASLNELQVQNKALSSRCLQLEDQRDREVARRVDLESENQRLDNLIEITKYNCECAPDEACEFARQRDEAQRENERLQRENEQWRRLLWKHGWHSFRCVSSAIETNKPCSCGWGELAKRLQIEMPEVK